MNINKLTRIFEFLLKKEGKPIPKKYINSLPESELIKLLETHTSAVQLVSDSIYLNRSNITKLPDDLYVDGFLSLSNCLQLEKLPDKLYVDGFLDLTNCVQLTKLPDDLYVGANLDLTNCVQLTELPDNLHVGEKLNLTNCTKLTELPDNLHVGEELMLDSKNITELPDNLHVVYLSIKDSLLAKKYTDDEIYEIIESTGGEILGRIYR
jgi:hypothetical protein